MQTVTIARWGNSLGMRIPKGVIEQENIKEGDRMMIEASEGTLVIHKIRTIKKYKLQHIIGSFQPVEEAPEVKWGAPQGREEW